MKQSPNVKCCAQGRCHLDPINGGHVSLTEGSLTAGRELVAEPIARPTKDRRLGNRQVITGRQDSWSAVQPGRGPVGDNCIGRDDQLEASNPERKILVEDSAEVDAAKGVVQHPRSHTGRQLIVGDSAFSSFAPCERSIVRDIGDKGIHLTKIGAVADIGTASTLDLWKSKASDYVCTENGPNSRRVDP
ncbi:hypothetical protein, partial [Nocardioides jensenii]|uniref:hypothetical protein n=1 Tax=Nocardioides jensenii TaxID=1843 RepID=UPI0012FBFD47